MDICFLTCICLWQVQTRLFKVVRPGLVLTSPVFVSSNASHPAAPYGKSGPHWGREGLTQFAQQLVSAVTAPPLVGCVIWSRFDTVLSNYQLLSHLHKFLTESGVCAVLIRISKW